MGGLSITHWLIVLAVVVLVFGTKKLRNIGSDLGSAVKGFKDGMKGSEEPAKAEQTQQVTQATPVTKDASTVDVNAKDVR